MTHRRTTLSLVAALALLAGSALPLPAGAADQPNFTVQGRSGANGWGWTPDASVTITVRADAGSGTTLASATVITDEFGRFTSPPLPAQPGTGITVSDGVSSKSTVVTELEVTRVDPAADTVSGTATIGIPVQVWVHDGPNQSTRSVTVQPDGTWTADFSVAGPGQDGYVIDIVPGSNGNSGQYDADGDSTFWGWEVPLPALRADPTTDGVYGDGWPPGAVLSVTVDDPATGVAPDWSTTATASGDGAFWVGTAPQFDLTAGHNVHVTDGATTRLLLVQPLAILAVDRLTDLIAGTADAGSTLTVNAWGPTGEPAQRDVTANQSGWWLADFSTPQGDGSGPYAIADITRGWHGVVEQPGSEEATATVVEWRVALPVISATPPEGDVSGQDWDAGSPVTVSIDDPELGGAVNYAFTAPPAADGSFSEPVGSAFRLRPGQIVTASDGETTKTLVIHALAISAVQTSFDAVSGTAAPGSEVSVIVLNPGGPHRTVVADGSGAWVADFSVPTADQGTWDITIGTVIGAARYDGDGDHTWQSLSIDPGFSIGLPPVRSTLGLVDTSGGRWRLLDEAGAEHAFWFGTPGDTPMVGDWDCNGTQTPGLYRRSDGYVYLRNSADTGPGEIRFFLGNPGDIPLAGDFNGDGCDTVSVYRPSEGRVFVTNVLGQNEGIFVAEYDYYFGDPGDKPFVGDFDGNGVETIGLHRESTGFVYFRQTHTQGVADASFFFGIPGDRLVAGDWTKDYTDTVAIYRPADRAFYLRYTNTQGFADDTLTWGESSWWPVAGEFRLG